MIELPETLTQAIFHQIYILLVVLYVYVVSKGIILLASQLLLRQCVCVCWNKIEFAKRKCSVRKPHSKDKFVKGRVSKGKKKEKKKKNLVFDTKGLPISLHQLTSHFVWI